MMFKLWKQTTHNRILGAVSAAALSVVAIASAQADPGLKSITSETLLTLMIRFLREQSSDKFHFQHSPLK